MPVDVGGAGSGYRLPVGSYRKLLKNECERQCAPDPRFYGENDFEELTAAGTARAAQMFTDLLAAGEAITVAAWECSPPRSSATGAPQWLMSPAIYCGASLVRVYSDDVAEPGEFYGDMSGQVFERIPISPQHQPARLVVP
jgi:hypothetical protein